MQKIANITIKDYKQLQSFNKAFAYTGQLPYTRFVFTEACLVGDGKNNNRATTMAIMEFGEKFGTSVSSLVVDILPQRPSPRGGPSLYRKSQSPQYMKTVERNVRLLLEGKVNLVKLVVKSWQELGPTEMCTFHKLRTLELEYTREYDNDKSNGPSFHTELSKRIPGVESVRINDQNNIRLMKVLRNLSEKSPRATVRLGIHLPMKHNELEQFLTTPSPPITKLKICLYHTDEISETEFVNNIFRFLKPHSQSLRNFTLDCGNRRVQYRGLKLPPLPSLQTLIVSYTPPFLAFVPNQFPNLRKLEIPATDVIAFSGIVLEGLKELSLDNYGFHADHDVTSEIDCGSIELLFPNVEVLIISATMIRMALRFRKLVSLRISEVHEVDDLMWNISTVGVGPYIGDIFTIPIPSLGKTELNDDDAEIKVGTFKDLAREF